ncbi:alpha/beta fold hydrolase [Hydrogenophaga sp. IBVHS1]|uniref:alpha/beta fold hydrolase n=1 Tax=unclassified Hydrogenophaga TaxID=2610897 RepID=UPI000A2E6B21|nr:alpha/beta hydrolase [Hydrogenophaga sp. IBVHS1]OSZ74245.1 alpha/beta hydrolase [Hydrogenophaga sp. IBVHS1]
MTRPQPFFREAGDGPGVVCLHSNASSSSQWRSLMDRLSPRFRVVAPDSYGSGKSPDWSSDRTISLRDEVDFVEPALERAGSPLVLVGHSYGAAIALIAALANPQRVRALVLYEPTLFSLLEAERPSPNEADGIRHAVAAAAAALDAGDEDAAARHFIDYWMAPGSWQKTPEERKPAMAASVRAVRRWAHALITEPTPLAAFRGLQVPVLYMVGERSTASAHGVARLLGSALPQVEMRRFDRLGHMGPITHAELVNEAIEGYLDGLA